MHLLSAIMFSGLLALSTGCHSSAYNARVFHSWGWENTKDASVYLRDYRHVLVVWVYESHWEDLGPNRLTPYHFKGVVVRSYKGDWKLSERIAFVHHVDSPAPTNAPSQMQGELMFVFTNEHTEAEISVATGDFGTYNEEYAPALDAVFCGRSTR